MAISFMILQGKGQNFTAYLGNNREEVAWPQGSDSFEKDVSVFIWRSQAGQKDPNYRGIIGHGKVSRVISIDALKKNHQELHKQMCESLGKEQEKQDKIAIIRLDPIQESFQERAIVSYTEISQREDCRNFVSQSGYALHRICTFPKGTFFKMLEDEYKKISEIWRERVSLSQSVFSAKEEGMKIRRFSYTPLEEFSPMSPLQNEEEKEEDQSIPKERLTQEEKNKIGRSGEQYAYDWLKVKCKQLYYEMKHYSNCETAERSDEIKRVFKIQGMNQKKNLKRAAEITWHNANKDTFAPIDIWIQKTVEMPKGREKKRKIYIEVKSTTQSKKGIVSFGKNQIKYLREHGKDCVVFRVYGVDPEENKVQSHALFKGTDVYKRLFGESVPSAGLFSVKAEL